MVVRRMRKRDLVEAVLAVRPGRARGVIGRVELVLLVLLVDLLLGLWLLLVGMMLMVRRSRVHRSRSAAHTRGCVVCLCLISARCSGDAVRGDETDSRGRGGERGKREARTPLALRLV